MFKPSLDRKTRLRREARALADRGIHRAEELREALPEASDVLSELREQAHPVVEAARERAGRARHRRSRSRMPLIGAVMLGVAALVAYFFFSRRDKEPAYLVATPETPPDMPAADGPEPDGTEVPSAHTPETPAVTNGATYRAEEPVVAPTAATPASAASTPSSSPASSPAVGGGQNGTAYGSVPPRANAPFGGIQARAQAAWDLPPSTPPGSAGPGNAPTGH